MRKLLRFGNEMRNQSLRGLWFALLFAFAPAAFSASFTVTLDRYSVVLGEQATLTLTFQDGQPEEVSNLPQVEGLRIASNVSRTMNSVFNNGAQTTVYAYSVALEPTRVGEFVIPPFQAKIKGESFSSQPLKLKVIESDPSAPPPAFANKVAFLWVVLPKTNLFINEPMVAELRLYFRSDVRRY